MKHDPAAYPVEETIRRLGRQYGELRRQEGFTQKEVSGKSGLSIFTISTFESGSSTGLTVATYIRLLQAIGCGGLIGKLSAVNDDTQKME